MKVLGLLLVAALTVGGDEPSGVRWRFECAAVRHMVSTYGEEAVIAMARARGVPERTIEEARSRCLRK